MGIVLTRSPDGATRIEMETAEELQTALRSMNGHADAPKPGPTPKRKYRKKKTKVKVEKPAKSRKSSWKGPTEAEYKEIEAKLPVLPKLNWPAIRKVGKKLNWKGDERTLRALLSKKRSRHNTEMAPA